MPIAEKKELASEEDGSRYRSAEDMRFWVYPRWFHFAMFGIMNHEKYFLKVGKFEDLFTHHCVQVEDNSLIDPCLTDLGEGLWVPLRV